MQITRRKKVAASMAMFCIAAAQPVSRLQQQALDAVRNATADPTAVQFRHVRLNKGVVCGEYNAKNLVGAYTGFEPFAFDGATGQGFLLGVLARISRKGVIESGASIVDDARKAGSDLDPIASQARLAKLTDDARATLVRCPE